MFQKANLLNLNDQDQIELIFLLEQQELEKVSPKMEQFRLPYRIKIAHGGRGAGAKSWSVASLLIQKAHRETLRICCLREVQNSLEESSYRLMVDTVFRLRYPGWTITKEALTSQTGSRIIFRGINDLRKSQDQMKSLEGYDYFWLEEASAFSKDSLDVLLPTLRKTGSELWATLNRDAEKDPVMAEYWDAPRNDVLRVELKQGKEDNPWFPEVLQNEMDLAYKINYDNALHVWGGAPRQQGDDCIMNRVKIKAAMSRKANETDPDEFGVDVARFGSDKTEIYRRHGAVTIGHWELIKKDTQYIANFVWELTRQNPATPIKVDDTGVGGGVTDRLNALGANVIAINFGGIPKNQKKYTSVADEMWFDFPLDEAQIPDDSQLMEELAGRRYEFDKLGRRIVESKKKFKERFGRSPDKADALLLTYYTGYNHGGGVTVARTTGL
jgi:phage terminase large subunit